MTSPTDYWAIKCINYTFLQRVLSKNNTIVAGLLHFEKALNEYTAILWILTPVSFDLSMCCKNS